MYLEISNPSNDMMKTREDLEELRKRDLVETLETSEDLKELQKEGLVEILET